MLTADEEDGINVFVIEVTANDSDVDDDVEELLARPADQVLGFPVLLPLSTSNIAV